VEDILTNKKPECNKCEYSFYIFLCYIFLCPCICKILHPVSIWWPFGLTIFYTVTVIAPSKFQWMQLSVQSSCNPYRYNANDYCLLHVLNMFFVLKQILKHSYSKENIVICIAFDDCFEYNQSASLNTWCKG